MRGAARVTCSVCEGFVEKYLNFSNKKSKVLIQEDQATETSNLNAQIRPIGRIQSFTGDHQGDSRTQRQGLEIEVSTEEKMIMPRQLLAGRCNPGTRSHRFVRFHPTGDTIPTGAIAPLDSHPASHHIASMPHCDENDMTPAVPAPMYGFEE